MEQLLVVVVFAAIALLNRWLSKRGGGDAEEGDGQTPEQAAEQRDARERAEQERVRKFMEALGVPAESLPPPRKPRQPAVPPPLPKPAPPAAPPGREIPDFEHQRLPEIRPPHPTRELQRRVEKPAPAGPTHVPSEQKTPRAMPLPPPPPPEKRPPAIALPSLDVEVASPRLSVARDAEQSDIRSMLRSRQNIRSAILLREILGPPRALEQLANDPARSR